MLRCLTVLILVVAIGAGALAYAVLTSPPEGAPGVAVATPTAVPAAVARQAASSFDQKIVAFEKSALAGGRRPIELVLTQVEVASKIQQMLAERDATDFQNVAVQLKGGGAVISGVAAVGGMSVPVQADTELSAADGMLGVSITSIRTAGVDLPRAVQDQLLRGIRQATGLGDLQKIDVGIEVQTVEVTADRLRITGQTR